MLVLRRIHVRYHLKLRPDQHETALRAHELHAGACPVALTIRGCVDITTELEMEDVEE